MTAAATRPTTDSSPAATRGERPVEPLIFEKHNPGAVGVDLPPLDVPAAPLPRDLTGDAPNLPEVGQLDVIRHYTHLAHRNFSVDDHFYPLGSCTMKYNPKINEAAASLPGVAAVHPLTDDRDVQGILSILYDLRLILAEIAGLDDTSLQPCAGAHGEWTALKVIRAWFNDPKGGNSPGRRKVLAPDTAHGTNFASCTMCGTGVVLVKSKDGLVDLDDLRSKVDADTAAMMITNPNTAGRFDHHIFEIAQIIHDAGALLYLDGANMNAILGVARPGDFGVDVMHYNTHKSFSTPHGCGGPGAGPIAVRKFLAPYLPVPQVERRAKGQGPRAEGQELTAPGAPGSRLGPRPSALGPSDYEFTLNFNTPKSIGKVRSFFGQIGVLVRAWTYIRALGPKGLKNAGQTSVLNANYLAARLADRYAMPYFDPSKGRFCAHEFITVPNRLLERGVTLVDIAKRMIDYAVHPPTMHWPVHNCLMIEPTETESLATLDRFVAVMHKIADECEQNAATVTSAPQNADIGRLDEVAAARSPVLTYKG